jgi:predicted esterase
VDLVVVRAHLGAVLLLCACKSSPGSPSSRPASDTSPRASSQTTAAATETSPRRSNELGDAASAAAAAVSSPAPADALDPLTAEGPLVPLEVVGSRPAMVAIPLGATSKRPVVLALHGNFDRPEWQCDVWRSIVHDHAFVLCPRGAARPDAPPPLDRYTYGSANDVRREIDAALGALAARFAPYVDTTEVLYAGFSLGAILGVGIVSRDGARFPRAVLIEGGHSGWSRERARAYAAQGGKRVLFACGQPGCRADAATAAKILEGAGVTGRVVFGGNVGHTYDGAVARAVEEAMPWLLTDDARWSAF